MTHLLRTWAVRIMLCCLAVGGIVCHAAAQDFCGTRTPADGEVRELLKVHSLKTIYRGPRVDAGEWVIRAGEAWRKFWGGAVPADIKLDFRTQMVLIVSEGRRGRGSHLSFAEVVDMGKEIHATLHYGLHVGRPHRTDDIIWPCHVIVVDRSEKPVRFASQVHIEWEGLRPTPAVRQQQQELISTREGEDGPAELRAGYKLMFEIDGQDLLVSTTVIANNSPHALSTSCHYDKAGKTVSLRFCLIQNSDLLVRSQKKVRVTWRLVGLAAVPRDDIRFRVEPTWVVLSTAELGDMMPQLQMLHQEGVQWNKVKGAE